MKMPNKQTGAGTLVACLVLLVLSTIIVMYTAKSVIAEQRIVTNEYLTAKSFEAAVAGAEAAFMRLTDAATHAAMTVDGDGDGWVDADAAQISESITDSDQTYTVFLRNIDMGDFEYLRLTSIGCADGCAPCSTACPAHKVIQESWMITRFMPSAPPAPLIVRGNAALGGNMSVTNMDSPLSIWAGGDVDMAGSSDVTTQDGTFGAPVAPYVESGDATLSGGTADQFFESLFGATKEQALSMSEYVACDGTACRTILTDPEMSGPVIWVDGNPILNGGTIGSPESPVILIVNGDLKLAGNLEVYGVLYVMGENFINQGGGTAEVHGALIVETEFQATGTPNVNYDSGLLNSMTSNPVRTRIPGSWID